MQPLSMLRVPTPHALANVVALYMRDAFRHKLALITGHPSPPEMPIPSNDLDHMLVEGCDHAIAMCVEAFIHPSTLRTL